MDARIELEAESKADTVVSKRAIDGDYIDRLQYGPSVAMFDELPLAESHACTRAYFHCY